MTRRMGDATHDNVPGLAAAGPWDLVAGYVTGTPDVMWTLADWAAFPAAVNVTIDQGYHSALPTLATVRDVEPNAWSASQAVLLGSWDAQRKTIYCDRSDLVSVLAAGWQGDLWLAIPGWQPGQTLPATPGCTVVAVQNAQSVNGVYDESVVLDPTWPEADPMAVNTQNDWAWCSKCQGLYYGPNQATSVCPAGGQHAPAAGSFNYALPYSGS